MANPPPARFTDAPALTPRARALLGVAVVLGHVALAILLIRAFGGVQVLTERLGLAPLTVATVIEPQSHPSAVAAGHAAQGASGAAGKRAQADQLVAAPTPIRLPAPIAPLVAGTGSEAQSGAAASGEGTGGGNTGTGTGNGVTGNGSGGGTRPVKLAGDLVERDFPPAGRAKRLGTAVTVVLTVGTDGRVSQCRVHQPSGDPDADTITCKLAVERFRFEPARDADGNAVEAQYGWQQRFFLN
ncbi:TonB family protein [Novosphingobium sp.]|uniref:TonB family protein n=1 Tax=Novosphingobium sp. TaxID=1874826 RepID=UPI003341A292